VVPWASGTSRRRVIGKRGVEQRPKAVAFGWSRLRRLALLWERGVTLVDKSCNRGPVPVGSRLTGQDLVQFTQGFQVLGAVGPLLGGDDVF
jgi:hypothetical protein